mmetsp:Transcript_4177/g.11793  ORF Transcript_4177/g.11793 Transcript_4177/m.11793 type:complete len:214 (+) Transcript_4177:224-865(+)
MFLISLLTHHNLLFDHSPCLSVADASTDGHARPNHLQGRQRPASHHECLDQDDPKLVHVDKYKETRGADSALHVATREGYSCPDEGTDDHPQELPVREDSKCFWEAFELTSHPGQGREKQTSPEVVEQRDACERDVHGVLVLRQHAAFAQAIAHGEKHVEEDPWEAHEEVVCGHLNGVEAAAKQHESKSENHECGDLEWIREKAFSNKCEERR